MKYNIPEYDHFPFVENLVQKTQMVTRRRKPLTYSFMTPVIT